MAMTFGQFLDYLLDSKDLTKAEVARKLKKSQGYIYLLAKGLKPPPKPDAMNELAKAMSCTDKELDTLMTYSMRRALGNYGISIAERRAKALSSPSKAGRRGRRSDAGSEVELQGYYQPVNEIPILAWVNADKFVAATDGDFPSGKGMEGTIQTELQGSHLFALRVRSNCMEPEFREGEIIIVDPDRQVESGSYVIVKFKGEDEATFKQLKIYDSRVILHPLNPAHKDIEFSKKQFDRKAKIIGPVVEKKKRY